MKDFIDIKPEFTLDKGIDNASPKAGPSSFTTLTNYIPEQGCISSRRGISELSFTGTVFSPLDDPDLVMWLRLESNGTIRDCEVNGIDFMSVSGAPSASSTKMEGSGSLYADWYASQSRLQKTTTSLPALFPCKGSTDWLITMWLKTDYNVNSTILRKDPIAGGAGTIGKLMLSQEIPRRVRLNFDDGLGGDKEILTTHTWWGPWIHIGIWHKASLNLCGLRMYHTNNGSTYNYTLANVADCSVNNSGSFYFGYEFWRGWMDDFLVFGDCPSIEQDIYNKIDTIRNRVL